MGYRSNVMCIIYPFGDSESRKEKYGLLKTLMATTFKDVAEEWGGNMEWLDDDCILEFDIENIKWYENYPEIQEFVSMRDIFHKGDFEGFALEFIRTGEDSDDIETYYSNSCEYYLNTETTIFRSYR